LGPRSGSGGKVQEKLQEMSNEGLFQGAHHFKMAAVRAISMIRRMKISD